MAHLILTYPFWTINQSKRLSFFSQNRSHILYWFCRNSCKFQGFKEVFKTKSFLFRVFPQLWSNQSHGWIRHQKWVFYKIQVYPLVFKRSTTKVKDVEVKKFFKNITGIKTIYDFGCIYYLYINNFVKNRFACSCSTYLWIWNYNFCCYFFFSPEITKSL